MRVSKMYVKTKCPVCGTEQYYNVKLHTHNVKLHALETKQFTDLETATKYAVEYIEVSVYGDERRACHGSPGEYEALCS